MNIPALFRRYPVEASIWLIGFIITMVILHFEPSYFTEKKLFGTLTALMMLSPWFLSVSLRYHLGNLTPWRRAAMTVAPLGLAFGFGVINSQRDLQILLPPMTILFIVTGVFTLVWTIRRHPRLLYTVVGRSWILALPFIASLVVFMAAPIDDLVNTAMMMLLGTGIAWVFLNGVDQSLDDNFPAPCGTKWFRSVSAMVWVFAFFSISMLLDLYMNWTQLTALLVVPPVLAVIGERQWRGWGK